MMMTLSLGLATNGCCATPGREKLSFTCTKNSSSSPGLRLAFSSLARSQGNSRRKRLRSVELSAVLQLTPGALTVLLCSSITHCCGPAEAGRVAVAGGTGGSPALPLTRVDDQLGHVDAEVVLGHHLQRDGGVGGAVLALARLFDLHRRQHVVVDDDGELLRAGVLEAVLVGGVDGEPERVVGPEGLVAGDEVPDRLVAVGGPASRPARGGRGRRHPGARPWRRPAAC